jgi:hypothetical protein
VLLLTPNGGKLTRTPTYQPTDNKQIRRVEVKLNPTGEATLVANTHYSGIQQDTRRAMLQQLSPEQQKEWLYKKMSLSGFEITQFALKEVATQIPAVNEQLQLKLQQGASKSGNRLFLNLNYLSPWTITLSTNEKRKTPVEWSQNFVDEDSVVCQLPTGYGVEYQPQPVQIVTPYGQYSASVELTNGQLYYRRRMMMRKGTYSSAQFGAVADFFKKVTKADKMQVVLVAK